MCAAWRARRPGLVPPGRENAVAPKMAKAVAAAAYHLGRYGRAEEKEAESTPVERSALQALLACFAAIDITQ
jgi:hypothetical protein